MNKIEIKSCTHVLDLYIPIYDICKVLLLDTNYYKNAYKLAFCLHVNLRK